MRLRAEPIQTHRMGLAWLFDQRKSIGQHVKPLIQLLNLQPDCNVTAYASSMITLAKRYLDRIIVLLRVYIGRSQGTEEPEYEGRDRSTSAAFSLVKSGPQYHPGLERGRPCGWPPLVLRAMDVKEHTWGREAHGEDPKGKIDTSHHVLRR